MSNYEHLFKELPLKCKRILDDYFDEDASPKKNREVTHMLVLASASIIVPLERLDYNHPLGEYSLYSASYDEMKAELKKPLIKASSKKTDSRFYQPNTWFYDEWLGNAGLYENFLYRPKPVEQYKTRFNSDYNTEQFLRHLRNALAHGNVFFRGRQEIEQLVFITKKGKKMTDSLKQQCHLAISGVHDDDAAAMLRSIIESTKEVEGYALLMTSVAGFRDFLSKWFSFVEALPYPNLYAEAAD